MIIAHLPAGYVISKLLYPRFQAACVNGKAFLAAGIAGAATPDLDMLYFHLVDQRQHHHHTYFTHYPIVWATLLLASALWLYASKARPAAVLAVIFSTNGFIHLILDTVVGDIWWFAPFLDQPFSFFTVPALYKPWYLNFIFHWSFALELGIVIWAVLLWRRTPVGLINQAS